MKKFFRTTYYAGITFIFVLVVMVGYTQTRSFRTNLQGYILAHYQTILKGQLNIGKLEGNLITGIRLYDVSVRSGDSTIFAAERIDLSHDPLSLFFKRVSLGTVRIVNPRMQIYRTQRGIWNVSGLLVSSPDTTPSAWTLTVKNLEIANAQISITDSVLIAERLQGVREAPPVGAIDYARVRIDSLNVEAELRLLAAESYAKVRLLTGMLENPKFHVRHLQGDFKLTGNESSVSTVKIETDRSALTLDAMLTRVNLSTLRDLAELKSKPVDLDLQVEKLDTQELKLFLYPWVDFLDKSFALQVQASGEFGKLNVHKVMVQTPHSTVTIGGTILNLHKPKDLELDLVCTNSVVDPTEVNELVPGLSLPDLQAFGKTRFHLGFKGTPVNFESEVKAATEAGTLGMNAQIKTGGGLEYKASFTTNDVDLGRLLSDPELRSRLSMNGTLAGGGTDVHSANAIVRVELDSSEFWGLPIGQSALVFDLSNSVLRSHAQLRARSTMIELSSTLRFHRGDSVSYALTGNVNSLNLADLIRSEQFRSDLSFNLSVAGTGISFSRMHNSAAIEFIRSSFGNVPFEKGGIDVTLNLIKSDFSTFSLRSDPVDLDVEGRFSLPALIENIVQGERVINDAFSQRIQTLDSLRGTAAVLGGREKFLMLQDRHPKFVDIAYRLDVRNLRPVGVFFQKDFTGSLTMGGSVRGDVDSLEFDCDARVRSFVYRNRSEEYRFINGTLSTELQNISRTRPLDVLGTKLDVLCDAFVVNKLSFYKTALSVVSQGDSGTYQWSALIDSAYQLDVRGTSIFHPNVYAFDLSQLRVGMDSYILENSETIALKLGRGALFAENLRLSHESEELGIAGYFSPAGVSDLMLTVNNFLLNDLKSVLYKTSIARPMNNINGILNATMNFKGTTDDPQLALDLTANGFRSGQLVFGQIVARTTYADHLLSLFVELRNRQRDVDVVPDFLVSGTVPYDAGFTGRHDQKIQGEINLTMYSKGLKLELLDPLLPSVSNLSGTLVCDTKIRGTIDAPTYEGSITLQNAKFLFNPLGIYFLVDGKLIPNGDRIGLDNLVVRNTQSDRKDGQMTLSGTFSLAGLKLEDFDLRADGQLLVLKESSRLAGQKFYGDLFLATGQNGVRWQGLLSGSKVTGDVLIKNAKITLPPDRENATTANRAINVIFRDDTSKIQKEDEGENLSETSSGERPMHDASLMTVVEGGARTEGAGPPEDAPNKTTEAKSFLDNISYELNIDVQGPASLLFVFNTQFNEELFADLKGKLAFTKTKNPEQTRMTGEVSLESRSFYNFIKRFDAWGKISFTGDPLNPELDVTARYAGMHTIDTLTIAGHEPPRTPSGQKLTAERLNVLAKLTGTKQEPKIELVLEFPDRDKNSQYVSKDPSSDALSFLGTGFLRDELDPQQRGSFVTVNMLSGLTTGLITGPLTNALKKQISAIQSVDVQYYAGDWNKTDVRVTAEISSAVIRFGGRVIEGINNTNITVEVPVGSVVGSESWRNLLFKYERRVDAVESIDQRRETNGLSLYYRIIF